MKARKTPLRKCVVTNEMKPKKELVRIVRTPEGDVIYDPTSKKSGRGAYLTASKDVFEQARQKDILSRHLKTKVNDDFYDYLVTEVAEGKSK
ncbi:RNase P modulator RnpM [Alteribacter keqinensis]|uniref:YlxR family protein n=1 Tax=Alteribacter keqinensis TaxID=2483800 RepID=A0A3M7TXC5_9BACI|nr:YlxR family protein [Alteribacter keqinensis]RNA69552.1 YlxR family protein [Alteribacter keqinensis]